MAYPRDRPHARIYREWMDLPAWTTLMPVAQSLIVNLLTRYRPQEPNRFELSDRTVAKLVSCSRNTARKALDDLEDRGWMKVVRVGSFIGPKARRASAYALTAFPLEIGMPPQKDFLHWKPDPIQRLKPKPSTAQIRAVNGSLQPPCEDAAEPVTGWASH
jgi:hypothetical protein